MSTSASSSEEYRPPLYPRAGSLSAGLTASPSFPDLERAVLEYWQGDDTFRASVENRPAGEDGSNEFVFYDGPPFANGLPHYGHLLTGYAKDVVPRYQTMRGRRVERRFGWDTHGLPAELEAERQLGITDKSQITETGIEEFNAVCRSSVLRYTDEWQDYVTRQGRWVDFENDYKTLNPSFMESVIWAFKQLYDKGLVYQGYRVLPYCWKDQTPLSNHELRMDDDVYKSRQDPSVTIGYRLESGEYVLIWTTTPWTVPSNQAVAVHPEVDYVAVRPDTGPLAGEVAILAEARVAAYAAELGEAPDVVARYRGEELLGRRYEPPFGYFAGHQEEFGEAMHTVLAADFVSTEDGTGIVHQAPAFGEEDKELTDTYGIRAVRPVDDAGRFDSRVPDYEGQQVFEANKAIIRDLKDHSGPMGGRAAVLVRHDTYEHSYPHCWRCRTPLIYRAVESWFVQVTAFKDRMVELNEEITWVPGNVKHGQFGTWLSNARDWSISRNRYWGSPIPVWMSDDPSHPRIDVYGSFAELEADFGRLPRGADGQPDLHRPFVDELTRPNPDDPTGTSTMRRVPDVLDVWFDSGSMSFAQVHYPFESEDWFEHHFPGDFIVEYIGQTRGWFYTLHVLATALFDRPAFRSCVSHGIVLGSDGQKMSKSLRNYPDVSEVFDRDGSDAMRWYLMSSPILRGGNLVVTEQGIRDGVRQVLLPLWNAWHFYATYANAEGHEGRRVTEATSLLDRYALAATSRFVAEVTAAMDAYDISGACELVRAQVDMLTNWYIRRSRRRFWAGGAEAAESFDVLFTCLETLARAAAPLTPFALEEIYRGLTGERSVHLADFPTADELTADPELVAAMQRTREICSVGSSLRKAAKRRVRQPLSRLVVALEESLHPEMVAIIAEELNAREVEVVSLADAREAGFSLQTRLTVHARAAGPRLGQQVQVAIRGSKTGDWSAADGRVVAGGIELREGEFALEEIADSAAEGYDLAVLSGSGFIALDTRVTPELEAEGLARDTIRAVQAVRKELDLAVSDRIRTRIVAPAEVREAIAVHEELIAAETLSLELSTAEELAEAVSGGTVGEGTEIRILVERA